MHQDGTPESEATTLGNEPVSEVATEGPVAVVRLAGELDLYNASAVREALMKTIDRGFHRLVVDLSEVVFMDSTTLGVLTEARKRLPASNGLVLAAPRLETRRALEITGLDRHFSVFDSVEEAVATGP